MNLTQRINSFVLCKINLGIFVSTLKIPRLVFDLLHPCLSHFAALYIIIFLIIVMYNPDTNDIKR